MILSFYCDGRNRDYRVSDNIYTSTFKLWENFKEEIICRNRYFPNQEITRILSNLNYMNVFPTDSHLTFYRARVGDYLHADDSEMMAPPIRKPSNGRCNPSGIPYLYLANNELTAIQEIRPQIGDIVTLAEFDVNVSNVFSFDVYLMEHYKIKAADEQTRCLLFLILQDLSSPVKTDNQLDYIPLQYICEYVKRIGYNAFIYSSVYGTGMNLVMFDWINRISLCSKKTIHIRKSQIEYDKVSCLQSANH